MEYLKVLKGVDIFKGFIDTEIGSLLQYMLSCEEQYEKGEYIYRVGDRLSKLGIVIEGSVEISTNNYSGNYNLLSIIKAGEIFGESFHLSDNKLAKINVLTCEKSRIIFLDIEEGIKKGNNLIMFKFIKNLIYIISKKNIEISQKINVISQRTTRERILEYLNLKGLESLGNIVELDFTRGELSDYLCVSREGLSREISRLRDDGLIEVKGNIFKLKKWIR